MSYSRYRRHSIVETIVNCAYTLAHARNIPPLIACNVTYIYVNFVILLRTQTYILYIYLPYINKLKLTYYNTAYSIILALGVLFHEIPNFFRLSRPSKRCNCKMLSIKNFA